VERGRTRDRPTLEAGDSGGELLSDFNHQFLHVTEEPAGVVSLVFGQADHAVDDSPEGTAPVRTGRGEGSADLLTLARRMWMLLLERPGVTWEWSCGGASWSDLRHEMAGGVTVRPRSLQWAQSLLGIWLSGKRDTMLSRTSCSVSPCRSSGRSEGTEGGGGYLEKWITRDELCQCAAQRPDVGGKAVLCPAPDGLWCAIPTGAHVMGKVALAQKRVPSAEFVRKHHSRAEVAKLCDDSTSREVDENVLRLDISVDLEGGRGGEGVRSRRREGGGGGRHSRCIGCEDR
jgi:hypothetical protein